jgi:LysM repeat protein
MRRTLAALALAMALPTSGLVSPPARAQVVVVVKEGDTLSDIAERHGVGLRRLMQANGIADPDLVVVGQRLTIPGSAGGSGSARGRGGGSVTVKEGDTLSDIAERHGVGLRRLMQANGISDPDLVVVGQRLTIPGDRGGGSAPAARNQQPTAPYTVKSGETLSEIAARFNTSTDRLIQLNGIQNPDQLRSGTRLKIPMAAKPRSSTAASAPARPSTPDRRTREHVVQSGESLSAIAERYGTSVSQLVALNRIEDPDRLQAGTRLQLRGTPPAPEPKPAPQTAAQPTPRPATEPSPATTTAAAPEASPQAEPQARPAPKGASQATAAPAPAATTPAARQPANAQTSPAPTPSQTTQPQPRPATASRPTTPTAAPATAAAAAPRPSGPGAGASGDWRPYGPLKIDWSKWQTMGGSYVAPSLDGDGKARYMAVNCTAGKLNTTTSSGQWNSWSSPEQDFERKLVQDICREKGS